MIAYQVANLVCSVCGDGAGCCNGNGSVGAASRPLGGSAGASGSEQFNRENIKL